jgi:hypothetical protein
MKSAKNSSVVKRHIKFSNKIKYNLSKTLNLTPKNKLKFFKDSRHASKIGYTSQYQLGIKINTTQEYNRIQRKLLKLALEEKGCSKKSKNAYTCNVAAKSNWYEFGQCREKKICHWSILFPEKFGKPGIYKINHGLMERVLINPKIMRKDTVLTLINLLGKEEQ